MKAPTRSLHRLLGSHAPAVLSEREAILRLRPHGQGVQRASIEPPINQQRPAERLRGPGALGELQGVRGAQRDSSR